MRKIRSETRVASMEETTILTLRLLSALRGESSSDSLAWSEASPVQESLLWAFDIGQSPSVAPAGEPKLDKPLPPPKSLSSLEPGNYYFLQWKEGSYAAVEDGIEDFIRQLWWEGKACRGPLVLRVLREEGRRTFQVLRALA